MSAPHHYSSLDLARRLLRDIPYPDRARKADVIPVGYVQVALDDLAERKVRDNFNPRITLAEIAAEVGARRMSAATRDQVLSLLQSRHNEGFAVRWTLPEFSVNASGFAVVGAA